MSADLLSSHLHRADVHRAGLHHADRHSAYLHSAIVLRVSNGTTPVTTWVNPRLLRGASRFTHMLLHVAERAVQEGGGNSASVATVYGSQYGEIETMTLLLDSIFVGDGQLSPMRFKNSVHNAASGLGSIGQSNRAFSTAIAAGPATFSACVLEAWSVLFDPSTAEDEVVIAIADDVVPAALAPADAKRDALAYAFLLSRTRASGLRIERPVFAQTGDAPQDVNPAAWCQGLFDWAHQPSAASATLLGIGPDWALPVRAL